MARSAKSYKNLPLRLYQISKTPTWISVLISHLCLIIRQHRNIEMSFALAKASFAVANST